MNVVALRKGQPRTEDVARRNETASQLSALLRRRTLSPLDGRRVWIEFKTEQEAALAQKLIIELAKPTRR